MKYLLASTKPYILLLLIVFFLPKVQGQTLRIMTYNIHHANPPASPGKIDLAAIARVINNAQADIIGIQEVDIHVSRSEMVNQAEKLAELTNTNYYFSKGIDLEKGFYGTLILTKHKIVGQRRYELPMPQASEARSLAIVDVELPTGEIIAFANTHLDLKETNQIAQATHINELGDLYQRPLILVGDLNGRPDAKHIKILENCFVRNTETNGPTFPMDKPNQEIDYIMLSKNTKFKWISYAVIPEDYASDHRPLVAEIVID